MWVRFEKVLEDRVILLQNMLDGYTIIECEKMEDGEVNPIPLRMYCSKNFNEILLQLEEWSKD